MVASRLPSRLHELIAHPKAQYDDVLKKEFFRLILHWFLLKKANIIIKNDFLDSHNIVVFQLISHVAWNQELIPLVFPV